MFVYEQNKQMEDASSSDIGGMYTSHHPEGASVVDYNSNQDNV